MSRTLTQTACPDAVTAAGASANGFRAEIRAEHSAYHGLERHGGDADRILRAKLHSTHWRARMAERLLAAGESGALDREELIGLLTDLAIRLTPAQQSRLAAVVPHPELRARVHAVQGERLPGGDEVADLAGPDLDLKIEVNRDSPWPFERWRREQGFTEYRFEEDGVRYRGLHLRPGDLILPNVNLDGNFVYSALSEPKGFCPHSAVFVILEGEGDGQRYPAVIETYEKGLRAVPLCVFLNARYISYAEIYRHRGISDADVARVSQVAYAALDVARGYNFDTLDDDRAYVCCTTVARQLYQDLGLPVLEEFGTVEHPGIRANLQRLDYHFLERFFTPVDFVRSPLFELMGWVDNNQPARLVTRELVEARFRHCFATGTIDPDRMPLMARINHFGIGHMRRRTLLGRLVSRVMGFDHVSLPKGPDRILAIVEPLEAELGRAVRALMPEVEERLAATEVLDLDAWLDDPQLRRRVADLLPLRWLDPA